jgi:flagellar biosynthesis/type III secretory pathway protein FliH
MAKTRYPPSKIRYLKANPNISFNVPVELKDKIDEISRVKGMTKSQLVKTFFLDMAVAFDSIKQTHAAELEKVKTDTYQNAYQKGASDKEKVLKEEYDKNIEAAIKFRLQSKEDKIWNDAYNEGEADGKAEGSKLVVNCSKCNKPMSFDISETKYKNEISAFLRQKYTHSKC